jgi:MarR family transcriptional regulator for hemolysin
MAKMVERSTFLQTLAHASRELQTAFDAHLKGIGLTTARGRALLFLYGRTDKVSQAEVTAYLRIQQPTAVRILDGMEDHGIIRRVAAEDDRRVKHIELTDKGRSMAAEVALSTRAMTERVMAGVTPEELATAYVVMTKFIANATALGAASAPHLEDLDAE